MSQLNRLLKAFGCKKLGAFFIATNIREDEKTQKNREVLIKTQKEKFYMKKEDYRNYQQKFPMNLQFFAEGENTPENTGEAQNPGDQNQAEQNLGEGEQKPTKTYEDALSEIAAAQAEVKKLKAERDAALKKSGDATKALRAKMTEAELEAEKKEAEEEEKKAYITELENYKAQNEALKRYLLQGMSNELAEKAAKAEIDGDMDGLADIQRQHTQALIKEKESEWKASRPQINVGSGDEASMTREEIMAIKDPKERQLAIAKNLKQFE